MSRPLLTPDLSPEAFSACYWLKKELQDFCSAQNSLRAAASATCSKIPKASTLGQALDVYQSSHVQGVSPIQRQFQFNQHIRDFFAQHPDATRAQALQAWQAKRQIPQALVFSADTE